MTGPRCTQAPTGAAARAAAMHRTSVPVIETARLRLRAPTLDDLPGWTQVFLEAFADEDDSPDRAWTEFSYYTAGWMLHGHGLWAVDLKDGTLAGFVMVALEWDDWEPELGWMMLPDHRGRGYASEAAAAARDYGHTLLPTFVSYIDPANTASSRVAARLGAMRDADMEARIAATDGETIEVWRHGGSA